MAELAGGGQLLKGAVSNWLLDAANVRVQQHNYDMWRRLPGASGRGGGRAGGHQATALGATWRSSLSWQIHKYDMWRRLPGAGGGGGGGTGRRRAAAYGRRVAIGSLWSHDA